MYDTTSDFMEAINKQSRELTIEIKLTTLEGQEFTLTDQDIEAGSFQITTQCMNKGFELGSVSAGDLAVTLDNRDERWNNIALEGAKLEPKCGVRVRSGLFEYIPMGVFIIDSPSRPYSALSLKATDQMILLDRDLSQAGVAFPTSPRTLLLAIETLCGVTISPDTLSLPNFDEIMIVDPQSDITCRDALSQIALLSAGFARFNRNGILEIVPLQQPNLENSRTMNVGSRKNLKVTTEQIQVTGMIYEGLSWGSNEYALRIKRLSILDPNKAQSALTYVWEQIMYFHYTGFTSDYYSDPSIDVGDGIYHVPFTGAPFLSIVTKHSYRHGRLSLLMGEAKSAQAQGYISKTTRELTEAVKAVEIEIGRRVTAYERGQDELSNLMGSMLGVHMTIETDDDTGAKAYLFHDKPTLEESSDLWRFDGGALAHSSDGGATWDLGLTSSSNLIIKMIQAIGIEAEWIHLQQGTLASYADETGARITQAETNITEITDSHIRLTETVGQHTQELQAVDDKIDDKFVPIEEKITTIEPALVSLEGRVALFDGEGLEDGTKNYQTHVSERFIEVSQEIEALALKQTSLEMGQGNLLMNPSFGTGSEPDGAFWYSGLTWGEAKVRGLTYGTAKASGKTWGDAKLGRV